MDPTVKYLFSFFMILTRISGMFMVLPIFSWKTVPVQMKISLIIVLSIFFSLLVPVPFEEGDMGTVRLVLLLCNEGLYGLALGLVMFLLFYAVKTAGEIIEKEMGFSMGETFDPLSGEGGESLSMIFETIFVLLFLSAGGHHLFLMGILRSYEAFPAGAIPSAANLTMGIVTAGSTMLALGLRLAAPILAAFLVLMAVLGIFARIMPDMNILFESMPLRVGMGLLIAGMFIPFINYFCTEFAEFLNNLLPI